MATTVKGSIIKSTINVTSNSLGENALSDVGYEIDFYAKESKSSQVTGVYKVVKGDTEHPSYVDGDNIIAKCDTTGLDLGKLYATLTLTYNDTTLGQMKEVMTLPSDIQIVEQVDVNS